MAKVHFEPMCAVKYVGAKAKDFNTSLARPKPRLKKGDIVIVDKKTSFNLIQKGFGEFVEVKSISFTKADAEAQEMEDALTAENEDLITELEAQRAMNEKLLADIKVLQAANKEENE